MNPASRALFRLFRANETRVHELNYLFWECTTRCNLRCRHCGSDCKDCSGEKDMPFEDFLKAFDTIPADKRPHPFTVVITGGEPLLRPDLPEIGRELRRRGVGWSIVSNGWLYDEEMHRRLMAAQMGALTISLDGLEEDHDWMRGREGSFARAINAIAIAARQPHLNFDVVTCVNQRNLPHLQEIYDQLEALGVKQWRIFTIIPIGRALDHPEPGVRADNLHLTDAQFVQLMDFIAARRTAGGIMNTTFSCEGYLGPYECKVRQTPYFCHAGINIASVLIDGTICACPNIDRQHFGQGNIYTDNLWEVWNTRFQPFRNRDWARQGQCKDCKAFKDCLGNGMHNWHAVGDQQGANGIIIPQAMPGDTISLINCHYHKILRHQSPFPKKQ
ncbi:MAG: TIGR04133 family radical SAM/SPASM protein [Bacteroidales bacterium]|nr:TIGR04133 family radical SAM/SPASM protein [Bacteroidales bacterium]